MGLVEISELPNCIDYVYSQFDFTENEKYKTPITLKDLRRHFLNVETVEKADIVAMISTWAGEMRIIHLALIDHEDNNMVWERKAQGYPVKHVPLRKSLGLFMGDFQDRKAVYMKRRDCNSMK